MDEMAQPNHLSDHDLLIELRTEMRGVRADVKDIKDNTNVRLLELENEKIDKDEVARLKGDADKIHEDHEARLRTVERAQENFMGKWAIIAAFAVIIISAIVGWGASHLP